MRMAPAPFCLNAPSFWPFAASFCPNAPSLTPSAVTAAGVKEGAEGVKEASERLKEGAAPVQEGAAPLEEGAAGVKEESARSKEAADRRQEGADGVEEKTDLLKEGPETPTAFDPAPRLAACNSVQDGGQKRARRPSGRTIKRGRGIAESLKEGAEGAGKNGALQFRRGCDALLGRISSPASFAYDRFYPRALYRSCSCFEWLRISFPYWRM